MIRFFYSFVFFLLLPVIVLRLLIRGRREPGYRKNIAERFGFVGHLPQRDVIWVHCVSAGETIAAVPLIRALLAAGHEVLVTNMTPAGRERCQALLGDEVTCCYVPYDVPPAIHRFLNLVQPKLLLVIDTELWPNLLQMTHARGVPVVLANGRLSLGSFKGYARFPQAVTPMLAAVSHFLVQTPLDAERFERLGVASSRIRVSGSIKFDNPPPADVATRAASLRERIAGRPVLLGASTHDGEEAALLDAFVQLRAHHPTLLLVLAPRHIVRVPLLMDWLGTQGQAAVLFSGPAAVSGDVLVIDAMGELAPCYAVADVALVGGSLVPVGGHNLIEAADLGAAIVMGPHVANIEDLVRLFSDAGGMRALRATDDLTAALRLLLDDPGLRNQQCAAARAVCERNRGAVDRVMAVIAETLA